MDNQEIKMSADDYFEIAFACNEKEDFDCAIENYTKAIELDTDYAAAFYNRGSAYYNKEDYDQSLKDFDKAIELDSNIEDTYIYRALIRWTGQLELAIQDFDKR